MTQATFDIEEEDGGIEEIIDTVQRCVNDLSNLTGRDVDDVGDLSLARFVAALKHLEKEAESTRKDVAEQELHERVDEGEQVGPLTKYTGSRRYIDDEDALELALHNADADPADAKRFNAKDAEELLDAVGIESEEYIGYKEYEYFRS